MTAVLQPSSNIGILEEGQILRTDLQKSLKRSHIDPSALSTFQRILLTTDGTVTHMLESYLYEQIQVVKLSEELVSLTQDIQALDLKAGTEVIARRILLRGKISRRNFIYAESIIIPERLDEEFRQELLESKTPIGKIWFERRVETFKEIIDSGKEQAEGLSNYFDIESDDNMLFRTYSVLSQGKPTMMITEKFPESYFLKDF
jgi:chorismate-pyruvate lyase